MDIQKLFVEKVLLGQMLQQKFRCTAAQTRELIQIQSSNLDPIALTKFGIGAAEFAGLISPFLLEAAQ